MKQSEADRQRERYRADPAYRAKRLAANAAWRAANPDRKQGTNKEWYQRTKEQFRSRRLVYRRKWRGFPEPTRPAPSACECCGKPPTKHNLSLDHDHTTGKFRGWLCQPCNLGIGRLGDILESINRAVTYLERNK